MKKIRMIFVLLMVMFAMAACGESDSKGHGKTDINIVEKSDEKAESVNPERDGYDDDWDDDDFDEEDLDYDLNDYDDLDEDDDWVEDDWDEGEVTRIEVGGHAYEYFEEDITWAEAREACIEKGGHLVTITDQEEADLLYEFFYDKKAWIGAFKFAETWYWVTHESWGFTNWDNNEPSNSKGEEWCVHLWTDMRWNDLAEEDVKNKVAGYICEFDEYIDHGDY